MSDSEEIKKLRSRLNIVGLAALGAVVLIFVSVFSAGDRSAAVAFALVMTLVLVFLLVRYSRIKLQLRKTLQPQAGAMQTKVKIKAQTFRLLFYLTFFVSVGFNGWVLAWGAPLREFVASPIFWVTLISNFTLAAAAIYFSINETERPAKALWKTDGVAGQWILGLLFLPVVILLLIVVLAIMAMVTQETYCLGPIDIGPFN